MLSEVEVKDKIKQTIIKTAELKIFPEEIKDNTKLLDEFGLDSIMILEILLNLEKNFNIQFGEDEIGIDIFDDFACLSRFVIKTLNK